MMGPFGWFKFNIRILRVLNSCDRKSFEALVDEALDIYPKLLSSRWYLWNVVRGRDYYKMMAHYVVTRAQTDDREKCETILRIVLHTTKDEAVRRNFIWAIMKQVPLLTIDTVPYASREKIQSILRSDKFAITDEAISPFVREVIDLRLQIKDLEEQVSALTAMLE